MPFVDASIAFCLTMLLMATVVTSIVDFIRWVLKNLPALSYSVFRDGSTNFQNMLNQFLRDELAKIATREFGDQAGAKGLNIDGIAAFLAGESDHKKDQLANVDLVDKLKQTELGKSIITECNERATQIFDEIGRRYAAVEKDFTKIFRQRARIVASVVALILAILFNIDSINIIASYLDDPALSATIAAKADGMVADYEARIKKAESSSASTDVLNELKARQTALQKDLQQLSTGTFPFGYSYFPWGDAPPKPWKATDKAFQDQSWKVWGGWVIGLALTSGLAGLGAPFWYDAIRGIARLARS